MAASVSDPRRNRDHELRRRLDLLALNLAPNPFAALEIMFWLMGSLADRGFEHLWLACVITLGGLLLLTLGGPLDALTLGGRRRHPWIRSRPGAP